MNNIFTIIIILATIHYSYPRITLQNILELNKTPNLRPLKKKLGYYEDTYLNFTELTSKYGYPTEEYKVTTEDGYILTVFRILSKCNKVKGYPVLLMHGIIDSSDGWIIPNAKGLGYVLANDCFDVWTVNNRGNVYSRKHRTLDPDRDHEYWNFSFDEAGYYDIPATIDHILMVTQKKKVFYIGHSQGCTNFFVTCSQRPEYNDKVQLSIQLAPVAWMGNIRNALFLLASRYVYEIASTLRAAGIYELAGKNQYVPHELVEFLCQIIPLKVCGTLLFISVGAQYGVIPPKTLTIVFGHLPAGTSVKTLEHFGQLVRSRRFQGFDEGKAGNLKRYGTMKPPPYDVTRVSSPIVLIGAKNDWLSDIKDVKILSAKLPNLVETYIVPSPVWSHNDHIWGMNASVYDFPKILQYLNEFSNR